VVQNVGGGGLPTGTIILWYGTSANVPDGFEIYAPAKSRLIMGAADGEASTIQIGDLTHTHTMPNTGTSGTHTHGVSISTGTAEAVTAYLQTTGNNPASWNHTHSLSATTGSKAGHFHTTSNTGSASNLPTFRRLHYIQQIVPASDIAVGSIIISAEEPGELGEGWQLCDGTNGTPDLRGRFVYAADVDGDVNTTGGVDSHSHTNSATGGAGGHQHSYSGTSSTNATGTAENAATYGAVALAARSHNHSFSGTTATDSSHTHTLGNTNSEDVLPPYINLYYVMRVS